MRSENITRGKQKRRTGDGGKRNRVWAFHCGAGTGSGQATPYVLAGCRQIGEILISVNRAPKT